MLTMKLTRIAQDLGAANARARVAFFDSCGCVCGCLPASNKTTTTNDNMNSSAET